MYTYIYIHKYTCTYTYIYTHTPLKRMSSLLPVRASLTPKALTPELISRSHHRNPSPPTRILSGSGERDSGRGVQCAAHQQPRDRLRRHPRAVPRPHEAVRDGGARAHHQLRLHGTEGQVATRDWSRTVLGLGLMGNRRFVV